jgi:hypothetical protein
MGWFASSSDDSNVVSFAIVIARVAAIAGVPAVILLAGALQNRMQTFCRLQQEVV